MTRSTSIEYTFDWHELFYRGDWTGIDREKSMARFVALLTEKIQAAYPSAKLTINNGLTERLKIDPPDDPSLAGVAFKINTDMNDLYEDRDQWLVKAAG